MMRPYSAKASKGKDEKWLLEEKYGGKETAAYEADKKRLALGEPLAYVIGWQPFLDLKIYLDSKPLIPRTETEWWAGEMFTQVSSGGSGVFRRAAARGAAIFQQKNTRPPKPVADLRFLDLCAGSGAIGCAALSRLPQAQVYFGEINKKHEPTILKNIHENGLDEGRATIRIGDLFEPFDDMRFDVIAANPPYVPADRALPTSVAEHEPPLALRAGEDGLNVIRRIAQELPERLAKTGVAWIECDRSHAETARGLFEKQGLKAKIRTDQYDTPRFIVVSFS